jgi:hypothetical protein
MKYLVRVHPDNSGTVGRWDETDPDSFSDAGGDFVRCKGEHGEDVTIKGEDAEDFYRYLRWRAGDAYDLMPDPRTAGPHATRPGVSWDPSPLAEAVMALDNLPEWAEEADAEAEGLEVKAQAKRDEADGWRSKIPANRQKKERAEAERDKVWDRFESETFGRSEV